MWMGSVENDDVLAITAGRQQQLTQMLCFFVFVPELYAHHTCLSLLVWQRSVASCCRVRIVVDELRTHEIRRQRCHHFYPNTQTQTVHVQRCVHLLLGPNYIRQSSEANEVNVLCPVTIAIATGARFRSVVAKTYPWRILFWSCRPHTRHRYNHQHGVTAAADADTVDAYWLATVSRCSHTRIALVPCRFTRIRTRM